MPKSGARPITRGPRRARGERLKQLDAYLEFLNSLDARHGGQAIVQPGENAMTVQRNLKIAADLLSRKMVMRRSGKVISFYMADGHGKRGRRGRLPKSARPGTSM